jgi:hypothetical protein
MAEFVTLRDSLLQDQEQPRAAAVGREQAGKGNERGTTAHYGRRNDICGHESLRIL